MKTVKPPILEAFGTEVERFNKISWDNADNVLMMPFFPGEESRNKSPRLDLSCFQVAPMIPFQRNSRFVNLVLVHQFTQMG